MIGIVSGRIVNGSATLERLGECSVDRDRLYRQEGRDLGGERGAGRNAQLLDQFLVFPDVAVHSQDTQSSPRSTR